MRNINIKLNIDTKEAIEKLRELRKELPQQVNKEQLRELEYLRVENSRLWDCMIEMSYDLSADKHKEAFNKMVSDVPQQIDRKKCEIENFETVISLLENSEQYPKEFYNEIVFFKDKLEDCKIQLNQLKMLKGE